MSMDATPLYTWTQQINPFRPLDWRWQRAQSLVEHGRYYVRRRDDEMTGRAVYFLRALRRSTSDRRRSRLTTQMPDVSAAYRIENHEPQIRLELQARILAGQSAEEIADRLQIFSAVVDMYEGLFFHVRDRLHASTWIVLQAIGGPLIRWPVPDSTTLLRNLAYFGGSTILEIVLPYLAPEAPGCHRQATEPDDALDYRAQLLITLLSIPNDQQTALRFLQQVPELERNLAEILDIDETSRSEQIDPTIFTEAIEQLDRNSSKEKIDPCSAGPTPVEAVA